MLPTRAFFANSSNTQVASQPNAVHAPGRASVAVRCRSARARVGAAEGEDGEGRDDVRVRKRGRKNAQRKRKRSHGARPIHISDSPHWKVPQTTWYNERIDMLDILVLVLRVTLCLCQSACRRRRGELGGSDRGEEGNPRQSSALTASTYR
ncbi:hypothetical protein C8F01DRAFT_1179820 [Mycena amicta]|nr:hypothetical protein C8F01DRAFT_1179820 [Mycena amicta]